MRQNQNRDELAVWKAHLRPALAARSAPATANWQARRTRQADGRILRALGARW